MKHLLISSLFGASVYSDQTVNVTLKDVEPVVHVPHQETPCLCAMVRCSPGFDPVTIPGTENNCCNGTLTCVPKCESGEARCTLKNQQQGLNCALNSCIKNVAEDNDNNESSIPLLGAFKDEHGCLASAGYQWCELKQKCHRHWEEPCEKEEENKSKKLIKNRRGRRIGLNGKACRMLKCIPCIGDFAIDDNGCQTCQCFPSSKRTRHGATKDINGCLASAGYQWCEAKQKCHRHWEEPCEEEEEKIILGAPDEHGCVGTHSWCESSQNCQHWSEACPNVFDLFLKPLLPIFGASNDENGCLTSAGYQWCEAKQKCHRNWEEPCEEEEEKSLLGDSKDENGCLASAGYQWCEIKQKCHRHWEEPCEEEEEKIILGAPDEHGCVGTHSWCESSQKCQHWSEACEISIEKNSSKKNLLGASKDENGCLTSAGYQWCEVKQKCHRHWEEPCEEEEEKIILGAPDEHGCVGTHSWCESLQKCQHWSETCEGIFSKKSSKPLLGASKDENGCLASAGYQWCEAKRKCHRHWEEPCEEEENLDKVTISDLLSDAKYEENLVEIKKTENHLSTYVVVIISCGAVLTAIAVILAFGYYRRKQNQKTLLVQNSNENEQSVVV